MLRQTGKRRPRAEESEFGVGPGVLVFSPHWLAALGIIGANIGMGALLLFLSDRIFGYIEMREFGAE